MLFLYLLMLRNLHLNVWICCFWKLSGGKLILINCLCKILPGFTRGYLLVFDSILSCLQKNVEKYQNMIMFVIPWNWTALFSF